MHARIRLVESKFEKCKRDLVAQVQWAGALSKEIKMLRKNIKELGEEGTARADFEDLESCIDNLGNDYHHHKRDIKYALIYHTSEDHATCFGSECQSCKRWFAYATHDKKACKKRAQARERHSLKTYAIRQRRTRMRAVVYALERYNLAPDTFAQHIFRHAGMKY